MEKMEFQKILFATAICAMACDGDIVDKEIAELQNIIDTAQYFKGIDTVGFSKEMIGEVKSNILGFVSNYFKQFEKVELSAAQELLLLEIVIRIIEADDRIDENEVAFLKHIRSQLNVYDEIILQRFGAVPYLTKGVSKQFTSKTEADKISLLANKIGIATAAGNRFELFFDETK